jgi:tRNA threonylcarbamoyladenosine modification (KEOPS) complex  Pcc1 subunit
MNVRQRGFDGSKRTVALGLAMAEDMSAFRAAIESYWLLKGRTVVRTESKRPAIL